MKWFWVKIVLRHNRGYLVGPVAHIPVRAATCEEASQLRCVTEAEDRLWNHLERWQHGTHRIETNVVQLADRSAWPTSRPAPPDVVRSVPRRNDVQPVKQANLFGQVPTTQTTQDSKEEVA